MAAIISFEHSDAVAGMTAPVLETGRVAIAGTGLPGTMLDEDLAAEDEADRHWGIAIALSAWPLCLGASAVLTVL